MPTAWRWRGWWRPLRPDIAHVNALIFPGHTWLLRRAAPAATAIVVQNHSPDGAVGRAPRLRLLGRACRRAVDAFLFAAHEHADPWRKAGFIAPAQPTYQVMEASSPLRPVARGVARTRSACADRPRSCGSGA